MVDEKRLKPAHGNWVDGERFWNRQRDIELFIERLDEKAHLLVVAQRRMGKTSMIREVARRLTDRYVCVYADLQRAKDPPDAIVELSLALHKAGLGDRVRGVFARTLEKLGSSIDKLSVGEFSVTLRAGLNAGDWSEKGTKLIESTSEKPTLLLFDEVPILVNRILKGSDFTITAERREAADEWMSWIRDCSIRFRDSTRMVLTGSIGFEPVLRQAGLSATLNTFDAFELGPWDDATARGCLEALAAEKGLQFEPGAPQELIELLGYNIPHYVQMFFDRIHEMCFRRQDLRVSIADVHQVYEGRMLSTRGHAELAHYEDRLEMVLGREVFPLALEMLTEVAVVGHLASDAYIAMRSDYSFANRTVASGQEEVMRVLEHDGYLKTGRKGPEFVSRLLRDWWRARHSLGYTPILKRL